MITHCAFQKLTCVESPTVTHVTPSPKDRSSTRAPSQLSKPATLSVITKTPSPGPHMARPGTKRSLRPETEALTDRRRRNNAAAAKYRQKKVDQIADLQQALKAAEEERDALKLRLAKRDAEVEVLRQLLSEKR